MYREGIEILEIRGIGEKGNLEKEEFFGKMEIGGKRIGEKRKQGPTGSLDGPDWSIFL